MTWLRRDSEDPLQDTMRRLLGSSTSSGKRGRGADGTAIVSVKEKDVAPCDEWLLVEAGVPEGEVILAALPPPSAPAPRVALLDTRLLNSGALKVLRFDTVVNGLSAAALNTTALPRQTRICLLCPESHACTWLTGPASVGDILSAILDGDTRAADADVVRHSKARRGADARVLLLECPHCGSLSSVHSPTRCPRQELMGLHLVGVTAGAAPVAVYQPTWSTPACVEALVKSSLASDENTAPSTEVNALVAFIK
jgi:hypothetical protein